MLITSTEAEKLIKARLPRHQLGSTCEDILSDRDYPPFNRVMMDGICVSWHSYQSGKRQFQVSGICPAGAPQGILSDFETCLEVMTGAPLPTGATLVIPYEHIEIKDGVASIVIESERIEFQNVHMMGSDAKKGDVLLKQHSVLNGPRIGIAKSVGHLQIKCEKFPRVNIISTGDELVDVDVTPLPHQIRRSNVYALKASLERFGYQDVTLSHLNDDIEAIKNHYHDAKNRFDYLIYSGGVSKGKFDFLPSTWKELGVTEYLHGVAQRPGKPLWFGADEKSRTYVFGLPGNPVSSLVCLHRYLLNQKTIFAKLAHDITFKNNLTYFVPVTLEYTQDGELKAHPVKIKNSGEFTALAESDGFLELPQEQEHFSTGSAYRFYSWSPM